MRSGNYPAKTTAEIISLYQQATAAGYERHAAAWYPAAQKEAQRLADRYGLSLKSAAGIIAALSPVMRWQDNIEQAEQFISGSRNIRQTKSNRVKAQEILLGADPDEILQPDEWGHKVFYFYKQIDYAGQYYYGIPLDTHMNYALGRPRWAMYRATYMRQMLPFLNAAAELQICPGPLQCGIWLHSKDIKERIRWTN